GALARCGGGSARPARAGFSPSSASSWRMRSFMLLSYLTAVALTLSVIAGPALQNDDPDALYRGRETLSSAQRAEQIWADRLKQNPNDFESAWKLARARYWLGGHVPGRDRKAMLESGIEAGRAAVRIAPEKPDGHFWIAANMGALAESFGLRQGLKYKGPIRDELETVLRIDP